MVASPPFSSAIGFPQFLTLPSFDCFKYVSPLYDTTCVAHSKRFGAGQQGEARRKHMTKNWAAEMRRTLASCWRRSEAPTAAAAASEAPTAADKKLHKQTPFLTTMTQLHQNHLPLQQLTLSHRQKMKAFPCLVIAKVQKCAFKVR